MVTHPPRLDEIDGTPDEVFQQFGIAKEVYRERQTQRLARDETAPEVGAMAPEFELERLTPRGARTGETLKLSQLRGQPVALVFGSYT